MCAAPTPHPDLLEACRGLPPVPTAVAHPCDPVSLESTVEAARRGLIRPTIFAPLAKLRAIAAGAGLELGAIPCVDVPHSHAAAEAAVAAVRRGEAAALMKGSLHTDEVMAPVVAKEGGLRTGRRISHCYVMEVPGRAEPLIISDGAINILPDLAEKVDIVQNAIDLARALRFPEVRVAILSCTESVNPKIPGTLEAAALCKMADRGQIAGALIDGPLALDNAISPEAAATKRIVSPVAGRANVLIVPDLEAGNMLAKSLSFLAGAEAAGIVLGARVPVILTSRADSLATHLASCALALLAAAAREGSPAAAMGASPA
ncbi:phosphate acetyltransferase [Siccirubricoccus phaeus]|uniref:phosphate acetyltransferase n=1 Tax=Siccirubricoccus phaeus TaxID=2595053 RepID=UPI0011F0C88C